MLFITSEVPSDRFAKHFKQFADFSVSSLADSWVKATSGEHCYSSANQMFLYFCIFGIIFHNVILTGNHSCRHV